MALAAALIHPADVLVLDEPTNHLDAEMTAWLEDWLRRFKGGLVMVTHDRYFLERVVNHITELSRGKLYHYEANYSKYLELKAQRAEMAEASERKRQSILRTEREWIMRGCRARTTKSKDRIERYEALKNQEAPETDDAVQLAAASAALAKSSLSCMMSASPTRAEPSSGTFPTICCGMTASALWDTTAPEKIHAAAAVCGGTVPGQRHGGHRHHCEDRPLFSGGSGAGSEPACLRFYP